MSILKSYRTCFVPLCLNTTKSTPNKIFLTVPQDVKRRNLWFKAARRVNLKSTSNYFCCEDHFDLEKDMENYMYYKMMGGPAKIKTTVVPHKFACQPDRKRRTVMTARVTSEKRKRRQEVDEIVNPKAHVSSKNAPNLYQSSIVDATPKQPTVEKVINASAINPISSEKGDSKVAVGTQTTVGQCSIGIQVNIRPKTRSVHSMCQIRRAATRKCSPVIKFAACVDCAPSAMKTSPEKKFLAPKSTSTGTNISSINTVSSGDSNVPVDSYTSLIKEEKLEIDAEEIFNVDDYFISMNPKVYLGIAVEGNSLIDLLSMKTRISADHIKLSLLKIRSQDSFELLGEQFCTTPGNASRIFSRVVPILSDTLRSFIFFPDENLVKEMLPIAFRSSYSDVRSVVDVLEIRIEKPSDPVNQALTWSKNKKCNTLKYLISCTPDGFVNFISTGYGGRISDFQLFEKCGILGRLPENCAVIADRGFENIQTLLMTKQCELMKSPSLLSTIQPVNSEELQTKRIASLRIHVERTIEKLREFDLLKPHAVVKQDMLSFTDDIIVIVSGLINLEATITRK